jgi:hypothetical protein
MSYFRRFQHFAEVAYQGEKFAGKLNGVKGTVVGFVQGSERGVVVAFDEDAYIMDEARDLAVWKERPKVERPEKETSKVAVEKRKGVAKGKRRQSEEEDD